MAQAKTLTAADIEQLLNYISKRKYAARNRSMMLLTHWAGLRIGEVACLRWSDVTNSDGKVKDEIRLLPDMTKGRHARTVFVSAKLKAELQAYADEAKCIERNYPFFASQKVLKVDLVRTVCLKHLPCFTRALGLKAPAATADAGRF